MKRHLEEVNTIQNQIKQLFVKKNTTPVAFEYGSGHSNTTRSKSYKANCPKLYCGSLNRIVHIDPQNKIALVEPRVTMQELVKTLLSYGLTIPVVPEFKGITVGGAIMGAAAESSSFRYGIFNDTCLSFEVVCGNGEVVEATRQKNSDLFYGLAGSYGSLGLLTLAEIKLIPAPKWVKVSYKRFHNSKDAVEAMQKKLQSQENFDFIDGIVFSKSLSVLIEGKLSEEENSSRYHLKNADWYFQHAKDMASQFDYYEEQMPLEDYLFRYDQAAFWMGAYLFHPSLLSRFILQGLLKITSSNSFNEAEVKRYHQIPHPSRLWRKIASTKMSSQRLWALLHKAEKWVQQRFCIQDFCIPESLASSFLEDVIEDPKLFPLWLCPIKATKEPQIFSPHLQTKDTDAYFINIGMYGLPSYACSLKELTKKLEQKTHSLGGRKVLYSHSYYTLNEFWNIYSQKEYLNLREKTQAFGLWHDIIDKVLSE